MGDNQHEN